MQNGRVDLSIVLKDGRHLGYAEYGVSDGFPVLYCTGGNSSRFEGMWFEESARQSGIRLVVPDRPGFGLSDFQPNRQFLDWPNDVSDLANALLIDQFSIFGLSGGGPHVLATAHKMSDRITKAAVVSGVAPPEMPGFYDGMWFPVRLLFITAKLFPNINSSLLNRMAGFYSDYDQMTKRMVQFMPAPDADLISSNPLILKTFARAAQEAHQNGVDGDAWEWQLYVKPWEIDLEAIQLEIFMLYGIYDRQVPIRMGRYLSNRLPRSYLVEVEDGGHFSTINNYIGEIFEYLAG